MPLQEMFNAAVKIIQELPKEGPYQPSIVMKLRLYSLFKQGTEGPCAIPKPAFYHVEDSLKWKAWKKLYNMTKEEAMISYVSELKKIIGTMPYNEDTEDFLFESGLYSEYENIPSRKFELKIPRQLVRREDTSVDRAHSDDMSELLPQKTDLSESSSSAESSGGTDSFVICEAITENFKNRLPDSTAIGKYIDSETEDEYSDPAETLDLPKFSAMSPSGSAFFSVTSNQGVISLDSKDVSTCTDSSPDGGLTFDGNARRVINVNFASSDREHEESSGTKSVLRGGDLRVSNKGLSADTSGQLMAVLQNIHKDLQAILIRLDTLEDNSLLIQRSRCSYCQHERPNADISKQKKWWPFPEISPRSTFFLLLYPFILPIVIKFFFMVRSARKREASMNR